MPFAQKQELKRYRTSFILMTLVSVLGILGGLYLYKYTDFFEGFSPGPNPLDKAKQLENFLLVYYREIRILLLMFIFGFTLFAPYIAVLVTAYKGFMTGFSLLYYTTCLKSTLMDKQSFLTATVPLLVQLIIYITFAAKACAQSMFLRYAAPDLISLLRQRESRRYIAAALILCAFCAVTLLPPYILK